MSADSICRRCGGDSQVPCESMNNRHFANTLKRFTEQGAEERGVADFPVDPHYGSPIDTRKGATPMNRARLTDDEILGYQRAKRNPYMPLSKGKRTMQREEYSGCT